jgi:membrane protein
MMPRMALPIQDPAKPRVMAGMLQALGKWPWRQTAATLIERFREDRLGLTASSLTFTTIIALVPMFTVMLAVFSAFPIFSKFEDALQTYFLQTLVPPAIARPVLTALTQFASKAYRLGAVGLVALVCTALALMQTIDRTLNHIWRVRKSRPLAQRMLVYWAAVSLGPLLLGMSLTFTSYALSASTGWVSELPGVISVTLNVLEFLLLAGASAALFHFVPNTHVAWHHALAGGVFVSLGIQAAKRAMAFYLTQVSPYAAIYGAFATVPLLLVWIYFGWVIVLLGAVVAAYAPSLRIGMLPLLDTPGHRFQLALAVLRQLIGGGGRTGEQLAQALHVDLLQVEPVLDALIAIDWVGRLDEAGSGRYVLLCDPARTLARPLVGQLLLDPAPVVARFWRYAGIDRMTLADIAVAAEPVSLRPATAAPLHADADADADQPIGR